MLLDLSMVLILCGKLLRKWASEFEWGMWRNIEWGIGIGVTVVGVLGIAAALYLVWKFRKNTGNSKMTAFAGSEPEKAGKTAKSSEGAAADKSETDEIEKSRQMQFEARAAAEAEKEQLFLKKSEKVPNELLVLVGGFAFFGWFQPLRHTGMDEKLLGLLISAQFDSYRRIVSECTDRKAAETYMDALMAYHIGGWSAFFESVNKSREEK